MVVTITTVPSDWEQPSSHGQVRSLPRKPGTPGAIANLRGAILPLSPLLAGSIAAHGVSRCLRLQPLPANFIGQS